MSTSKHLIYLLLFLIGPFIVLLHGQQNRFRHRKTYDPRRKIYLAGLISSTSTGGGPLVQGVWPAVELALMHVNRDGRFLRDYQLEMIWKDPQCDMALGSKYFFDMMKKEPQKVLLFGDACSEVTTAIAESTPYWNIIQISYGDTNPILSDRKTFPTFFRTIPSDSDYNPARIAFLAQHNWTRVGTLFQDASHGSSRYSYAHNKLIELLDRGNLVAVTESFSSDPRVALDHLKLKDVRVIIGNFDEDMARKVFCAVYERGMYGAKYVWLLQGDYQTDWWKVNSTSVKCTAAQILKALNGYFGTDVLELSTSHEETISTLTAQRYMDLYNRSRGSTYSKYHAYAYDAVWVVAKAIDTLLEDNDGLYDARMFHGDSFHAAINNTSFQGVTGRVKFIEGDRIGGIEIKQLQGDRMIKIAEYDALTDVLDMMKGQPIVWQSEFGAPRDRSLREWQLYKVNLTLYAILCTIASLGIVLALSFLAINIKFRNHSYIKMSSPNLNNLIIVGCIFAYTSVFLLGTDSGMLPTKYFHTMCITRAWVLCVGFTLSFGAMFSKTWRVHSIFTNIKLNKKVIKDYQLFLIVAVLFSIDFIILTVWQCVDPLRRETKDLPAKVVSAVGDVEIIPVIEFCISERREIWLGVIYAYKGIFMLIGCFLAWETRQVSIPALNDSKYIGMSVYNIVIMCVSGVPISFIIKDRPDNAYLIIALFIIFCTTITLCLVFVPKIIELRKDPLGDDKRIRATFRRSQKPEPSINTTSQKIKKLADEVYRRRQLLDNVQREIEELQQQLDEETIESVPVAVAVAVARKSVISLRDNAGSLGTLFADNPLLISSNSISSNPFSGASDNPPSDGLRPPNNSPEMIELAKIRRTCRHGKKKKIRLDVHAHEDGVTAAAQGGGGVRSPDDDDDDDDPPAYDTLIHNSKTCDGFNDGMRTPSYQGLKFLSMTDLYSLKETAILSDSDSELSIASSLNSLPDGSSNTFLVHADICETPFQQHQQQSRAKQYTQQPTMDTRAIHCKRSNGCNNDTNKYCDTIGQCDGCSMRNGVVCNCEQDLTLQSGLDGDCRTKNKQLPLHTTFKGMDYSGIKTRYTPGLQEDLMSAIPYKRNVSNAQARSMSRSRSTSRSNKSYRMADPHSKHQVMCSRHAICPDTPEGSEHTMPQGSSPQDIDEDVSKVYINQSKINHGYRIHDGYGAKEDSKIHIVSNCQVHGLKSNHLNHNVNNSNSINKERSGKNKNTLKRNVSQYDQVEDIQTLHPDPELQTKNSAHISETTDCALRMRRRSIARAHSEKGSMTTGRKTRSVRRRRARSNSYPGHVSATPCRCRRKVIGDTRR